MKELFDCIAKNKVWIKTEEMLPDEEVVVETKVEDENGCSNVTKLKRYRNLWFLADGSMYVYYTPTHWRYV